MLCNPTRSYRIDVDDNRRRSPSGWCLCFFSGRKKRNPYSGRGLDKFYSVLVELDAQRQKIVTEGNGDFNPTVWFVHSGSHNWVPVIVNLKGSTNWKKKKKARNFHGDSSSVSTKLPELNLPVTKGGNWSCSWRFPGEMLVLILLCLALFGRTSTIFYTTLWWCAVAAMSGGDGGRKVTAMKKIEYRRRTVSDKVLGSGGGLLMNTQNQNLRRGTSTLSCLLLCAVLLLHRLYNSD